MTGGGRAKVDRLLAIAPALEAAGVEPMSIDAEVKAVRAARRTRSKHAAQPPATPDDDAGSR